NLVVRVADLDGDAVPAERIVDLRRPPVEAEGPGLRIRAVVDERRRVPAGVRALSPREAVNRGGVPVEAQEAVAGAFPATVGDVLAVDLRAGAAADPAAGRPFLDLRPAGGSVVEVDRAAGVGV